jgi:hypothetical protein
LDVGRFDFAGSPARLVDTGEATIKTTRAVPRAGGRKDV